VTTPALAALLAALVSATDARAATLDFTFSFLNPLAPEYGGRVEGIVRGLTDNAVSAARSVEVTFNADGFGLGEYIGIAVENAWRVEAGRIVGADFRMFGGLNADAGVPGVTEATLHFRFRDGVQEVGLDFRPDSTITRATDLVFTRIDGHAPIAPVPLPAPAVLLLGGLGALAFLRRKRPGRPGTEACA
jgi:hypothetical protein